MQIWVKEENKKKKELALSLSLSIGQIQKHKRNNFQRQRVAARNIGHRVRSIGTVKQRLLPPFRMLDGSKYRETRTGWLVCLTRCSSFSGRWQQQEQTTHFLICTPPHGSFCPIFFFLFFARLVLAEATAWVSTLYYYYHTTHIEIVLLLRLSLKWRGGEKTKKTSSLDWVNQVFGSVWRSRKENKVIPRQTVYQGQGNGRGEQTQTGAGRFRSISVHLIPLLELEYSRTAMSHLMSMCIESDWKNKRYGHGR